LAEAKTNSASNRMGIIEYIEPQCFKNKNYKKNKESDIYSLGVLLWEISSGRPPFSDCSPNLVDSYIKSGIREDPAKDTPPGYQKLYEKCWDDQPKLRPNIEEVHETLSQLNIEFSQPNKDNTNNTNESKVYDIGDSTSGLYINTDLMSKFIYIDYIDLY
jgi:hypothetical protein